MFSRIEASAELDPFDGAPNPAGTEEQEEAPCNYPSGYTCFDGRFTMGHCRSKPDTG